MKLKISTIFVLFSALLILYGCADSKDPASPDSGVPYFEVSLSPPIALPIEDVLISLVPVLPLEFENMDGMMVGFYAEPDSGIFHDFAASFIDLDSDTKLSPPTWFYYTGFGSVDTLDVKIYAEVITGNGDVIAWNYSTLGVVANP